MDELVNAITAIRHFSAPAEIEIELGHECLYFDFRGQRHRLEVARLYRPSAAQVKERASKETVLVLTSASAKAIEAAAPFNHIVLPDGNFCLMAPGLALRRETTGATKSATTRARFAGRTGVVAETLLLAGQRAWSVGQLAQEAGVSKGLAHRVLDRLEKEGALQSQGNGPEKTRTLTVPSILAQAWSQEENAPKVALRGHLYAASPDALAQKLRQICPEGAVGSVMAANSYQPLLTRVPLPLRFWVPEGFWLGRFQEAGLETTKEGANVEIVQSKSDTWRHHRSPTSLHVSPWRAWLEISEISGRGQELAETLYEELLRRFKSNQTWK